MHRISDYRYYGFSTGESYVGLSVGSSSFCHVGVDVAATSLTLEEQIESLIDALVARLAEHGLDAGALVQIDVKLRDRQHAPVVEAAITGRLGRAHRRKLTAMDSTEPEDSEIRIEAIAHRSKPMSTIERHMLLQPAG